MNTLVPMVIDRSDRGERAMDIFSKMLDERIIFLTGEVNDSMATSICAQLLFLESQDNKKDIQMHINSPGGSVTAGLQIFGVMNYISCDISTICTSQAASMGAFLLSAGTKGKRFALPESRIMCHQPNAGLGRSTVTDLKIHLEEIERAKEQLTKHLANHCNKSYQEVYDMCERDKFFSAQEALDYGLIDRVITKRK